MVFFDEENNTEKEPEKISEQKTADGDRKDEEIFKISDTFAEIKMSADAPVRVPASGERVDCDDGQDSYILREPIMTDHSSITYETDNDSFFAKIYTEEALKIDLFENKARRMVKEDVNIKGVCWPKKILKDENGKFVGILVPASCGVQLTQSVLSGTSGLMNYFPGWDKTDLCEVARLMIDTICKLHRMGIYFGCFNPASVYIANTEDIYFVDADSWQIEGYPVMSKNITFTPPELLSDDFKLHLYSADEENYQVALLTFMLMMPGKYPYAKKKRNAEVESIRDMAFGFSLGDDMRRSSDSELPGGVWQIVWDHLPYNMCDSFYKTFHNEGIYSKPGTRLKDSVWLDLVEKFQKELSKDKNAASRELFPYTFRRDGKRVFVGCGVCGKEHPDFYFLKNIRIGKEAISVWDKGYRVCLPCAVDQSDMYFDCKACGKRYYYTNRTKLVHRIGKLDFDWNNQKWCSECKNHTEECPRCNNSVPTFQMREFRDRKRNIRRTVCPTCYGEMINEMRRWNEEAFKTGTCRRCGSSFTITNGQAEFYSKNGMSLPTHCDSCRRRRQ